MVSYGLAYGMEAYGLGQRLNIATEEAARHPRRLLPRPSPTSSAYMDRTVVPRPARAGYTETLFGRRRPIPELLELATWRIRQAGERQAMNAGIQGLAADIFKVALVRIDEALRERQAPRRSRLMLQVHDEVLARGAARGRARRRSSALVIELMRHAADLDVPLEVNLAWGDTWADTHVSAVSSPSRTLCVTTNAHIGRCSVDTVA